jgi:hypothetical protein
MAPVAIHHDVMRGGPTMKDQDSTEKDVKITTGSQDVATPKAAEPSEVKRELTDEQLAAVVGGIIGNHIGTSVV